MSVNGTVRITPSTDELDRLATELTEPVSARLSTWYRDGVVVAGAPTVRVRRWSIFVRYPLSSANADAPPALLVKIRRQPHLGVHQAIDDAGLRTEGRDDFEALRRLESLTENDPTLCAIRALDYFEDWSALVMEELRAVQVKKALTRGRVAVSRSARDGLEPVFERTGRLLRLFHEQVSVPSDGAIVDDEVLGVLDEDLERIGQRSPKMPVAAFRALAARVESLGRQLTVPHSRLHRDFNTVNVLVTADARVGLLDPRMLPGAVYRDIAKLMVDLDTFTAQGLSHGLFLRNSVHAYQQALLRGYFADSTPNVVALEFFRLVSLLDRWRYDEERATRVARGRARRMIEDGALAWRRRYLVQLAEHQRMRLENALDDAQS